MTDKIVVTRHVKNTNLEIDKRLGSVSAVSPGVMGITGIETSEIVGSLKDCINPNIIFKGTVHDGTGRVVDVYGFNEEEIVKLANEVKALDKNYNTVHIYGPENIWADRTYVGVKFLG